jgi:hypothetical protein
MLGAVYERKYEIAIYNAIGLDPTHIFLFFLPEAFVYGVIGSVAGYLVGQLLATALKVRDKLPMRRWAFHASVAAGILIAFELPPDFLLENTCFDIGANLMIFRWRLRRLYLWHFSCAAAFLTDGTPAGVSRWLAAYFNDARMLRGGHFFLQPDVRIGWRRLRRHLFAHRDQFARWRFKYGTRYRLDPAKNQLVAWVFNHRRPGDPLAIPPALRFD